MQRTAFAERFLGTTTLFAFTIAALAASSGAGCSQEVRDFEDPSVTTGQGGSGGTGTSSSGQGGDPTGGGGTGGEAPKVCEPGLPAYDGPLCGPPSMPCELRADELLASPPSFRNDAPSIAADGVCAPHISFSVAEGGFQGWYALRDAQGWFEEQTPFAMATTAIAAAPDGTPFVLAYNGAFGTSLWSKVGGQWVGGSAIPGQTYAGAGSMAREAGGVLHAAVRSSDDIVQHDRYDNGWTVTQLNAQTSTRMPIALSTTGAAHLAYWDAVGSSWQLFWISPPGNAEIAAPLGSSGLSSQGQRHAIAITAPDGQNPAGRPHLLFARPAQVPGGTQGHELAYATRQGAGAWNVFVLDQDGQGTFCNGQPQVGQMCSYDYREIWPIGVAASQGGDVRFVYEKLHYKGTSIGVCNGGFCYWEPQTEESTGQVLVGWIDGNQQPGSVVVADAIMAVGGTVALDAVGTIHVAAYDAYPLAQDGTTVRYLQIGP